MDENFDATRPIVRTSVSERSPNATDQMPISQAPRETPNPAQDAPPAATIRQVQMTVARINPFSALKISFLVSIGVGIMIVIASILMWLLLDSMHVWAQIDELLTTLNSAPLLELSQYMQFGRVVSFAVIVGVAETVLFTIFGTLMAMLYNLVAMLVGGVSITVTDE